MFFDSMLGIFLFIIIVLLLFVASLCLAEIIKIYIREEAKRKICNLKQENEILKVKILELEKELSAFKKNN